MKIPQLADPWTLYTSLRGRISRKTYWLWFALPIAVLNILSGVLDSALGTYVVDSEAGYVSVIMGLLVVWPGLVGMVKRLHDRDKTGKHLAALYGSLITAAILVMVIILRNPQSISAAEIDWRMFSPMLVWSLYFMYLSISIGFLRGTDGPNRYGPDPLGESIGARVDAKLSGVAAGFRTEASNQNYPSIAQSWGILGIMIASAVLLIPVTLLFEINVPMSIGTITLVGTLIGTGVPCWIVYGIRKKKTNIDSFNLTIENPRIIPLIVLAAIPLNLGIAGPLMDLIPMSDFFRNMMLELGSDQGLLMFAALVIAAPILEELIFRGIMLDGLLKIYSPVKAIVISSLFFGLIHLNPWQFVGGALVGGFMGWVYYHTRSVLATILIHASFNLTAFSLGYFIDIEVIMDLPYAEVLGGMTNYILFIAGSILITLTCVFFLNKEFKESVPVLLA